VRKNEAKTLTDKVRIKVMEKFHHKCIFCGSNINLQIHHIDTNRKNNELKNLLLVCILCHRKCHGRVNVKLYNDEIIKLWRSGFSYGDIKDKLKLPKGTISVVVTKMNKLDPAFSNEHWKNSIERY